MGGGDITNSDLKIGCWDGIGPSSLGPQPSTFTSMLQAPYVIVCTKTANNVHLIERYGGSGEI